MKKPNKFFLGAFVVLLGLGLWYGQRLFKTPMPLPDVAGLPPAAPTATKAPASGAPTQPAAASGATKGNSSKFEEMGILQRSAYLQEMEKMDLPSIFRIWLEAGRVEQDPMKQRAVGTFLGNELRNRPPDSDFYLQLEKFMEDNSNSLLERGLLILSLGAAKTKESLDLLVQIATTSPDEGTKQTAISAIRSAGDLWGDGKFHEELSPSLEGVWQKSQDRNLLISVSYAMAKVGAPSGIQLLLSSALTDGSENGVRKQAARQALAEVLNPRAVPVLSELLVDQPAANEASKVASSILANMTGSAAAQALLNWLQKADASVAPLAINYVAHARHGTQLRAYEAALDPAVLFHSEQIREAIRAGLAQRQARYK